MPVVAGAACTVIQQQFGVEVSTDEQGDKALVFHEPDGTARVYALSDDGRKKLLDQLQKVDTATAADLRAIKDGKR